MLNEIGEEQDWKKKIKNKEMEDVIESVEWYEVDGCEWRSCRVEM